MSDNYYGWILNQENHIISAYYIELDYIYETFRYFSYTESLDSNKTNNIKYYNGNIKIKNSYNTDFKIIYFNFDVQLYIFSNIFEDPDIKIISNIIEDNKFNLYYMNACLVTTNENFNYQNFLNENQLNNLLTFKDELLEYININIINSSLYKNKTNIFDIPENNFLKIESKSSSSKRLDELENNFTCVKIVEPDDLSIYSSISSTE